MGPIVWAKEYEKGGHFSGYERPDAVSEGLNEMLKKGGPCFGVVAGQDGY